LPKADSRAKAKWNAAHYAQVKVSVDPGVAAAFKAACAMEARSTAGVLSEFMALYSASPIGRAATADDVSTRKKRRRLVLSLARRLEAARDAEENYMSNIPENLRASIRYDNAEHSLAVFDEAIGLLGDIY
jgi:siderophore synthetase component